MPNHAELIDKLEKATEGSRELDAQVEVAIRWDDAAKIGLAPEHRAKWRAARSGFVGDGHTTYAAAPVTTSLDAIVALIERKLPGWCWEVTTHTTIVGGIRKPSALLVPPDLDDGGEITDWGDASTPALALCIALLRAIQHQGGGNG